MSEQEDVVLPRRGNVTFLVATVVVVGLVLPAAYVSKFGGSLSSNQNDWAAFGSYIGGAFGAYVGAVTLVAVILTLYYNSRAIDVAMRQVREARGEARVQRTFAMLQVWLSGEMSSNRTKGWLWFEHLIETAEAEPIYLGEYRQPESDQIDEYYAASGVFHFIADVNTLVLEKQIDEALAKSLFGTTFESWFSKLERFDHRRNEDDTSRESQNVLAWYEQHVEPLRERWG